MPCCDGRGCGHVSGGFVAAGPIACEAAVRRVEPFHLSPRYSRQEVRLLNEVMAAFSGQQLHDLTRPSAAQI